MAKSPDLPNCIDEYQALALKSGAHYPGGWSVSIAPVPLGHSCYQTSAVEVKMVIHVRMAVADLRRGRGTTEVQVEWYSDKPTRNGMIAL